MASLSVCIITRNEELNIKDCLETVKWADEIIIVDSESTDNTLAIAKQYTDRIFVNPYKGCGPQKKQALELATCEWALILDADERLTQELQQEIQTILQNPKYDAYSIPFQTYYCGKAIRFGDWINERHIRLIKKDKNSIVARIVHFRIDTFGTIGKLKHKILHYSFPTLDKVIEKMNVYSTLGAQHKLQQRKTAGLFTALAHGIFAFIRGYVLKLGFLDGKEGFMLAISNAEGSYYRYLKLCCMTKGSTNINL
jgi:glycosyltransferase involved in cell wall biosynthesis